MICDEDPLRRRPRESTARRKRQERCVWMARKMTEWPSKRGPITKIMPSDGCIGDTVPLAVGKWYDFHEFGWYMGNVGLNITTASQGLRPAGDFRSSVGLRHAASRRGRKSSHGTTSSILASGSFLASSPAYRCAMSKKPFWPMAGSPNPHVADPGFYPIRKDGRNFSRCPIVSHLLAPCHSSS